MRIRQPQKAILWLLNTVMLKATQWVAASATTENGDPLFQRQAPAPYTTADARINPMVVMAARGDTAHAMESDPEGHQAELNACMESVEAEQIKHGMLMMFGNLIGRRPRAR